MDATHGRRAFLTATASVAGTLGAAGCISIDTGADSKFRLTTYMFDHGLSEIAQSPVDIRSTFGLDYSIAYKQRKMNELAESGSVSTRGWGLAYLASWGETTHQNYLCLLYDDTYYRPIVESEAEVTRDTWTFYLDWNVDEPSSAADVATYPVDSLSDQDRRILTAAVDGVAHQSRRDAYDHGLSIEYHAELDPEASELVPEPPFDYLRTDEETFGAVAERVPVQKTERTISAEPVATSHSEFEDFTRDELAEVDFSNVDLSEGARSIVVDVTDVRSAYSYEEEPPLSDDLEEVLEHLGIADDLEPHEEYDEYTLFNRALAGYHGSWFNFELMVYP